VPRLHAVEAIQRHLPLSQIRLCGVVPKCHAPVRYIKTFLNDLSDSSIRGCGLGWSGRQGRKQDSHAQHVDDGRHPDKA
jgi:hypothetical protein